jgi:hypothetical protein
MGIRTESTSKYRDKSIAGDGSQNAEVFKPRTISKSEERTGEFRKQADFPDESEMNKTNQILLTIVADYPQELYEKDQCIQALENEIRGLKGSAYRLREKIL